MAANNIKKKNIKKNYQKKILLEKNINYVEKFQEQDNILEQNRVGFQYKSHDRTQV